jgi:hypothetical protein
MEKQHKQSGAQQAERLGRERSLRGVSEQDINQPDDRSLDEILNPDTDPDNNQYGNLDDNMDLYDDPRPRELVQDAPSDLEAEDQYGPLDPLDSVEGDTPGGQSPKDVHDQYGREPNLIPPGSDRNQYGTKGSQDQYGDQQNVTRE